MKKFFFLPIITFCLFICTIDWAKSQNGCDLNLIRQTFTNAGCTELAGCLSPCSIYFYNPISQTGDNAQLWAQNYGANLVSLQSASENACIVSELNAHGFGGIIWIGFNDVASEGSFVWYDQSPNTYTNWAGGEPNNSGDEDCVQIYPDGMWNDLDCSSGGSKSVIEVNLCPTTTITPGTTTICLGGSVSLPASTILGSFPYSYNWTSVPAGFTSTSSNPTVTPSVTTTYNVTSTDRYGCLSQSSVTINVNLPSVTITPGSSTTFCPGGSVVLTASNANTYNWNNGSTSQSITVTAPGNYSVVTVDANGCTATSLPTTVSLYSLPVISVTPPASSSCVGSSVNLTASGANTYSWLPANGLNTTSGTVVSASPPLTTTYTVIGTDNAGCVNTATTVLTVNPKPSVTIARHGNPLCDSSKFNWATWTLVNGSSATGTISSTLSVTINQSSGGLSTTGGMFNGGVFPTQYNVPINTTAIRNDLAGLFTFCFNRPVVNPQIALSSIGQGGVSVPVNTSAPYQIIWPGQGMSYPSNTTFIGTEGFTIIEFPGIHTCISFDYLNSETYCNLAFGTLDTNCQNIASPPICAGSPDTLTATGAVSYSWFPTTNLNTSTGAVVIASPLVTTKYYVTGTDANNCSNTDSITVTVNPLPIVALTGDTIICSGDSTTLTASGGGGTYLWMPGSFTDSIIKVSPTATTTYTVVVTNISGCTKSSTIHVTVNPSPQALFSLNPVCKNSPVTYTDASVGSISNWNWNYGDGNTSTLQNSTHIYSTCDTFNVKLVVTTATGCRDSIKKTAKVYCLPVADFGFTDVCLNQAMNFIDMSTLSGGSITGWQWDLGDTSPINATQSPSHTYTTAGSYAVVLTATSNNGCRDTITKNVVVHPLPVPQFSSTNVCDENPVQFNNSSTIPTPETIQSYSWNFGDGSAFNTNQNPSHIYVSAGNYSVHLNVISNFGCKDSIIHMVVVNPKPVALYSNTSICEGNATIFTDQSITTGGTISTWSWDFGDASTLNTTQNPSYTYSGGGGYNATLIVNNNFGCADTIAKPVQVYYNPTAVFTHNDVCLGDSVHFTNGSYVNQSTSITSYLWVFGDGSSSGNLQNAAHGYAGAGTYNATLVINSANGCSDAVSNVVNVYDSPVTGFTFVNTCLFDSVVFTNTSANPATGTISGWSWDFGDGTTLNTTIWSPRHLYPSAGNYLVTLITQSSTLGCKDTLQLPLIVFPMPISDFSSTDVCLNQVLNFNDLSTVTGGTIANWSWNFGDGSPLNTAQNASYTYTNAGSYPAVLIITTNNGCKDTVTKNVETHPLPDAIFSAANVCDGNAVQFNNLSTIPATDIIQSYSWNLGDGSPLSTTQAPSHLYGNAGTFTVRLTAVSDFGCVDSIIKTITVNPNPVVRFTADDTLGCEPLCVNFQNTSSILTGNNTQWLWDFGDGSTGGTTANAFHCYTNDLVFSPGIHPVTLTVTSDSGCVKTLTKNNYITVYPMPVASFTVKPEAAPLVDPVIEITNQSTGADFWNWNFGGPAPLTTVLDTSSDFNPLPHTYPDTGTYVITLIASTLYNCRDTAYQMITIEPDFLFYIPNAFSPNGDGKNETFQGYGVGITEYQMTIFDRWGNQLFKTRDYNYPWDGKANDGKEMAQQDVYIYVITITGKKTKTRTYSGTVTLVR